MVRENRQFRTNVLAAIANHFSTSGIKIGRRWDIINSPYYDDIFWISDNNDGTVSLHYIKKETPTDHQKDYSIVMLNANDPELLQKVTQWWIQSMNPRSTANKASRSIFSTNLPTIRKNP